MYISLRLISSRGGVRKSHMPLDIILTNLSSLFNIHIMFYVCGPLFNTTDLAPLSNITIIIIKS